MLATHVGASRGARRLSLLHRAPLAAPPAGDGTGWELGGRTIWDVFGGWARFSRRCSGKLFDMSRTNESLNLSRCSMPVFDTRYRVYSCLFSFYACDPLACSRGFSQALAVAGPSPSPSSGVEVPRATLCAAAFDLALSALPPAVRAAEEGFLRKVPFSRRCFD